MILSLAVSLSTKTLDISSSLVCISFFFSSRRRHTRLQGDWSSDVCSSDLMTFQAHDAHFSSDDVEIFAERSPLAAANDQIGRASCRERVQKSVEDNEVKQQQDTTTTR